MNVMKYVKHQADDAYKSTNVASVIKKSLCILITLECTHDHLSAATCNFTNDTIKFEKWYRIIARW